MPRCSARTCPKPDVDAGCPNVGAAAVLLLGLESGAGVLLVEAQSLPPEVQVELVAGAAASACVGLLASKLKLGVLEFTEADVGACSTGV